MTTRPRRIRARHLAPDYQPPRHRAPLPPERRAWLIAGDVMVTHPARRVAPVLIGARAWEWDFLAELATYRHPPSGRQAEILARIAAKVRA
jgi:hypothetical protein